MKQITSYKCGVIFRCSECKNKFRGRKDELLWNGFEYIFVCPVCENLSVAQEVEEYYKEDDLEDEY